jgi:Arc/MetJ family transcription regulator
MRTTIDIDDGLMRRAMRFSGPQSKKATVEAGLRLLVVVHAQGSIRRLKGKVRFDDAALSRRARERLVYSAPSLLLAAFQSPDCHE